eukprot:m.44476 g.44476  ORF g.44476 m.44476 type:complete len:555 (+) comp10831_c0_seq1:361-2025(+)
MEESRLSNYDLVSLVGAGTFGKAWLARDLRSSKQCVLKQIVVQQMDGMGRKAAVNEVRVLRKLQHPYIVRYNEAFCEAGVLHICMEYAAGGDLSQRISRQQDSGQLFLESKVKDYFTQLTLALAYIHRQGILHRDLKAQNIFLSARDHVKLGDFGISRVLTNTQQHATTLVGTPFYLSPEICLGRPYGFQSDVWALGCVLYELLTLKHAFKAHSISNVMVRIISGRYKPPNSVFSKPLHQLLAKLLEGNPARRYTAQDVLHLECMQYHVAKYAKACDMPHLAMGPADQHKRLAAPPHIEQQQASIPTPLPPGAAQRRPSHPTLARQRSNPPQLPPAHCQAEPSCSQPNVRPDLQQTMREESSLQETLQVTARFHKLPKPTAPSGAAEMGSLATKSDQSDKVDGEPPKETVPNQPSSAARSKEDVKFHLDAVTLHLFGSQEADSPYAKLEALRCFLELRIGEELLEQAYFLLTESDEDEQSDAGVGLGVDEVACAQSTVGQAGISGLDSSDSDSGSSDMGQDDCNSRILQLLGPIKAIYFPLILQMVVCERNMSA